MPPVKPTFSSRIRLNASAVSTLELLVYDEIGENFWTGGGVTAQSVADAIAQAGNFDRIAVRVNSPGGDCFEGVAIYNLLRAQNKPIDVFVDGLAASAASIIAMAGGTVSVGVGAMIMIHNAATFAYGDAQELHKVADTLDKISQTVGEIYVAKTKQSAADIKTLMDAETWMSAQEAIDKGFADKILNQDEEGATQARALVKSFNLHHCKHVPEQLRPAATARRPRQSTVQCECGCEDCVNNKCQNCTNEDCADPGCTDCPNQQPIGSHAQSDVFDDVARQRLALYERS